MTSTPPESEAAESMNPATWLEEHGDYLYGYAMKRVRDGHAAEELVQEALLTALERQETFEGRSTVRTWLVGILKYKVLQYYRSESRGSGDVGDDLSGDFVESQFTKMGKWKKGPANWGQRPEAVPEAAEFREILEDCLFKLPDRTAEAFLLCEQQKLNGEKLSRVLEASVSQVYVILHRARAALRKCLELNWFGGKESKEDERR